MRDDIMTISWGAKSTEPPYHFFPSVEYPLLVSIHLPLLGRMLLLLRMEFLGVGLEEIRRFHRLNSGHGLEGQGGDVVRLAFPHQGVIFEYVLLLRIITLGLVLENSLGFTSV